MIGGSVYRNLSYFPPMLRYSRRALFFLPGSSPKPASCLFESNNSQAVAWETTPS